jgi:hypothetical protein
LFRTAVTALFQRLGSQLAALKHEGHENTKNTKQDPFSRGISTAPGDFQPALLKAPQINKVLFRVLRVFVIFVAIARSQRPGG